MNDEDNKIKYPEIDLRKRLLSFHYLAKLSRKAKVEKFSPTTYN